MKNLIASVCAIALIVACKRPEQRPEVMRTIDGQIFIRTRGAETIKLSLVEVALFDAKAIAEDVDRKRKAAEPIYEGLQSLVKEAEKRVKEAEKREKEGAGPKGLDKVSEGDREEVRIAQIAWEKALAKSGKVQPMALYLHSAPYYFNDLPKPLLMTKTDADGKFTFKIPNGSYVLAAASSRAAGKETEFYHWMIQVIADADKNVMLANDNLSTSGSPGSMITTTEIDGDDLKAVEGVSLASMEALIEEKKEDRVKAAQQQERRAEQARAWEVREKEDLAKEAHERERSAEQARERELREQELAEYRQNPKAAQQKAVALYPDVGVPGSPLNKEFVARMKRYQAEKKEFFAEPDWPIRLGKECSEELSAKRPAKP